MIALFLKSILSGLKVLLDFVLSYWKQIAIVILLGIAVYQVYSYGYSKAYADRTSYYEAIAAENNKKVIEKIDSIEKTANSVMDNTVKQQQSLDKGINEIINSVKKKKFAVINDKGECIPSKDFIDAYNALTVRGNQK